MANIGSIEAQVRPLVGTGGARAVRREGRLPGVIYGGGKDPVSISIDPRAILKDARNSAFFTKIYDLTLDGKKERVIPRDLQLHVVKDHPTHIDFMRIAKGARLEVSVPIVFLNEETCPGIKRGGMLNIVVHEIALNCDAEKIPEKIEFDLAGQNLHASIHVSDLNLPKDAHVLHMEQDHTIATIIAPSSLRSSGGDGDDSAENADS
ncbi:MAG: 50S ribosomal protein L25/general stress protein Ctc [Alphaproteobacteria bacterium]|nr:50S ribosomal protein L25/general stress protein Ctc [Alphaproteobacteria bacterium]